LIIYRWLRLWRWLGDGGSSFLIALATFGMALTIPPNEKEECFRLTRPVWAAAALTNDVQSWEKECKLVALQEDKADMTNGIFVLMKQDPSLDVEEAKRRVLQKAKDFVAEYVETVRTVHDRADLSPDSRVFIEAMQYMVSGNLMWGISTPRYHPDRSLTDMQISRMQHGWPAMSSAGGSGTGADKFSATNGCAAAESQVHNQDTEDKDMAANQVDGHHVEATVDSESMQSHARVNGVNGTNGTNGTNGINGIKDINNTNSTNGTNGINGVKSINGVNGVNGVNGNQDHPEPIKIGTYDNETAPGTEKPQDGNDDVITQIVEAPALYVASLPSKHVRDKAADALNVWCRLPEAELAQVKRIISTLHNASLMLDDVEDGSKCRRGMPAAHMVFGVPQAINSAGHQVVKAMGQVVELDNALCLTAFIGTFRLWSFGICKH
jgi:hypothetical protein